MYKLIDETVLENISVTEREHSENLANDIFVDNRAVFFSRFKRVLIYECFTRNDYSIKFPNTCASATVRVGGTYAPRIPNIGTLRRFNACDFIYDHVGLL